MKNLIIVMFWRHNYFLLMVKNSQENLFKESHFSLKCNVRNTLYSAHTFKVLRANQSIFLLGTKETLKILSRYVWTPLMNILTSKLGFKILILVPGCNVCNMESPRSHLQHWWLQIPDTYPPNKTHAFKKKRALVYKQSHVSTCIP